MIDPYTNFPPYLQGELYTCPKGHVVRMNGRTLEEDEPCPRCLADAEIKHRVKVRAVTRAVKKVLKRRR